jgi:hypothetical protein
MMTRMLRIRVEGWNLRRGSHGTQKLENLRCLSHARLEHFLEPLSRVRLAVAGTRAVTRTDSGTKLALPSALIFDL